MTENEQQTDKEALEELRATIGNRGWKDSVESIIGVLEFFADLCAARELTIFETQRFQRDMQVTIIILRELQDGSYEEEVRALRDAVLAFNRAQESLCVFRPPNGGSQQWTYARAMAWRHRVDSASQVFKLSCRWWRIHLERAFMEHQDHAALVFIEQLERRLPILRSGRLADVERQWDAIEKCMLLEAKVTILAADLDGLRRYTNSILGPPTDKTTAAKNVAAFSRAIFHKELGGEEDWLEHAESRRWLMKEGNRLAALYDADGRLDSNEKVVHERACIDPLYENTGDVLALGPIDKHSLEIVVHPDVHMEIQDLDSVLKEAGLKPLQRRALLLRRNGKIMSRNDVNDWKRTQRAINRKRSDLVKAITAATKRRVIKAPLISAGSYPGIIREGAGYALPLRDEENPTLASSTAEVNPAKWFVSKPPPISRSHRKTQYLFEKVST